MTGHRTQEKRGMTGRGHWKAKSVRKKRTPRLKPTLWDGVVALCVAGLACALLFARWRGGAAAERLTAVVYADGAEIDRVKLSTDTPLERAYACNGYTLHAAFRADGVQVLESDCPTQDCVHTGIITHSGQSIVCLPARIVIRLEGGAIPADAPDAVLG